MAKGRNNMGLAGNLQQTLDRGSTATFTNGLETANFDELVNDGINFYSQKVFQDETTISSDSLALGSSIRQASYSEEGNFQSFNQDVVSTINEVSGSMNPIKNLSKEDLTNGHTGNIQIQVPTPKTGAGGVNVNIEMPYKEQSGTYRVATFDDVSNKSQILNKTTSEINAIASPIEGEQYYNTTLHTICFYNGTNWQKVTSTNM